MDKGPNPYIVILKGIGVSPRVEGGRVILFRETTTVSELVARVVVLRRITPDMAPFLRSSRGVIADEGGITSHGANLLREFGVPCVVGTKFASQLLRDGDVVTVDGWKGLVYQGRVKVFPEPVQIEGERALTATRIMASIEVPETVHKIAQYVDGISSFRNDYLLLQSGVHPGVMVERHRKRVEHLLYYGMEMVAGAMAPKPVWYKSLDAPTDEFRLLNGGEDEPMERNPLLGWRGIGREVDNPAMLETEYRAVARAVKGGFTNLGIKVPFLRSIREYRLAKEIASACGIEPHHDVEFGASIETPAMAMEVGKVIKEGVDFISVGINDLTMATLAADRGNERISGIFNVHHPAVTRLLEKVARTCREEGIFSCVCGRIGQDKGLLRRLVRMGFRGVGVSPPYIPTTVRTVADEETRILRAYPGGPRGGLCS